jgi:predicted  nucleic acid-binding Zn-ribbon protein
MSLETKLNEELDDLKRIRDEIRVQIKLGKAEAKDLWDRSEEKIEELESKVKGISGQAEQPLQDMRDAAQLLLDEIRDGYKRIRKAL